MLIERRRIDEQRDSLSHASECAETAGTLQDVFERHFEALIADTPDLLIVAQKLRYQVYCVENKYEDPSAHPDALESDRFDSHAVHGLLRHRSTQTALGTVRLILPLSDSQEDSFAIQRLNGIRSLKLSRLLPLTSTAEVSRFSISRELRRGADTQSSPQKPQSSLPSFLQAGTPLLRLGLIQSLLRMSVQCGITHWCAMMEPKLLRMLAAMAIRFEPIGAPVDHRGWRQPCFCNVAEVMNCVKRERPSFWEVLTVGGSLAI